jgi:4-hydroxy-2-oxoglutarate aldolase
MTLDLHGIVPPVPTPFTRAGDLDLGALQSLIAALAPDVDGFLILGSNGEAAYLSDRERRAVLEAAREAVPRDRPMLAGTGGEATAQVIERTREAADLGADAALVLAPHYYRSAMSSTVLDAHFRAVADASSVPVLVYNIPQVTGLSHPSAWTAALAAHENVVGLKDSSGDVMALTETLRLVPEGFQVMSGNAPTLLPALSVGARGGVLAAANVLPRAYRALVAAFRAGDLGRALRLQRDTNPLAYAVTRDFGVSGLKAAMRLQGLDAGFPRAPLQDLTSAESARLAAMLEAAADLP